MIFMCLYIMKYHTNSMTLCMNLAILIAYLVMKMSRHIDY
jgi:hypothetical protein